MDPTDGAVCDNILEVRVSPQRFEYGLKHVLGRPPSEALEHRVPVAEGRRQIAPRRAGAGNPEYSLDKVSVVRAGSPWVARLTGQQMGYLVPLRVAENRSIQGWSPFPALNPKLAGLGIPHRRMST